MEHAGLNVDGLALDLVGPASVVSDAADDGADITTGVGDGLSVVEGLDGGEEVEVLLGKVGKLQQQDASLVGGGGLPDAVEGLAGGLDGEVDVLLGTLADGGDGLLGGGVDNLELLLVNTLNPLAVNVAAEVSGKFPGEVVMDLQANGLGVGTSEGGVELDGQSHCGSFFVGVLRGNWVSLREGGSGLLYREERMRDEYETEEIKSNTEGDGSGVFNLKIARGVTGGWPHTQLGG